MVRPQSLRHHSIEASPYVIGFDASRLGLGAVRMRESVIEEYFVDSIACHDEHFFGVLAGDEDGQQLWGALAMLVALRNWRQVWATGRCNLSVEGDSMTALYLLVDIKSRSDASVRLAREVALELGAATYRPDQVRHIPGITSKLPDYLSRCMAPPYSELPFPAALAGARRAHPAVWDASWYLARDVPRRARGRKRERMRGHCTFVMEIGGMVWF